MAEIVAKKLSSQVNLFGEEDTDESSKEDFEKDSALILPAGFEEGSLNSCKHGRRKVMPEF